MLRSVDIPQADSLATIRAVVEAVWAVGANSPEIGLQIGASDRHVRYRTQAARVLGFIDEDSRVTASGRRLIATRVGSHEERRVLLRAVRTCRVVADISPDLFDAIEVDVHSIARQLEQLGGLSAATAERRARVLRSWRRQLEK
jgi:hypothetical protein